MADKTEEKAIPKVTNISGKKVPILQYVVMPDGRAIKKFSGEILPELPHDVADTMQCKRLAEMGLLKIEGYRPLSGREPKPVVKEKKGGEKPAAKVVFGGTGSSKGKDKKEKSKEPR